jgi:hypothetical protein
MVLSKPVIAAVSGYAVAGGLELALWCDLRVAEEDAVFGVFCRRWGVPLIDGGTVRLPRLIGHSRAMDMILTGRAVGAQEAMGIGLVNRMPPTWRGCRRAACAPTGFPRCTSGAAPRPTPSTSNTAACPGWPRSRSKVPGGSPAAPAGTVSRPKSCANQPKTE